MYPSAGINAAAVAAAAARHPVSNSALLRSFPISTVLSILRSFFHRRFHRRFFRNVFVQ